MKKNIALPLILGLIFLFASFLLHRLQLNHDKLPSHAIKVERELLRLQGVSENAMADLLKDSSFLLSPFNERALAVASSLSEEGINLLAFHRDSLIFWSNNLIAHSFAGPSDIPDTSMVWAGNGWYFTRVMNKGSHSIVSLILVSSEYPFQNQYLSNSFNPTFRLPGNAALSLENGTAQVHSSSGTFLFSLSQTDKDGFEPPGAAILFLIAYFFILLFLAAVHEKLNPFPKYPVAALIAFVIDALIIRWLLHFSDFPSFLYHSALFQQNSYSAGPFFESLGELALNAFTIIVPATRLAIMANRGLLPASNKSNSFLLAFLAGLASMLALWGTTGVMEGIFMHSGIPLNFTNLFSFTPQSYLALTLGIVLYAATYLFSAALAAAYISNVKPARHALWAILMAAGVFFAFSSITGAPAWLSACTGLILMLFLWASPFGLKGPQSISAAAIGILIFSLLATHQHNSLNKQKEQQQRILLAGSLSKEQDPVAEYLYKTSIARMANDTILYALVNTDTLEEDLISRYLIYNYFGQDPHWKKYNFQLTLCTPSQELIVKSDNGTELVSILCDTFFSNLVKQRGKMTLSRNLIYIDYGTRQDSYLGIVRFHRENRSDLTAYVEFVSRVVRSDLGFPALLSDQQETFQLPAFNYSYAFYNKGSLSSSYGKFIYHIDLENYPERTRNLQFFNENDFHHSYNHLVYRIDDNRVLLLSRENPGFLAQLSPISYFFLLFSFLALLISLIFIDLRAMLAQSPSFRTRMQITFIAVILSSFFIVGWASLAYLRELNRQKNYDVLSEKAHSVLIEVEHKLANVDSLSPEIRPYIGQMLTKFSNVFFTDINLFDTNGFVIATSRPQLFDEQLISRQMSPEAYRMMSAERRALFIHRESIGELGYLSAYIPFRNRKDELVAFLNLPYFVKEQELNSQIGAFLVTFINVYALLIALSILVAVFFAGLITRPLRLIRDNLRKVSLGGKNEAIHIRRKDEIGELVTAYNRMVDQLSESAQRLAASERQSAWREMAKQVAHEIKNPLTPMKLSVQYLEKAWDEKDPQWEGRLKRFSSTLIEQIDNLAQIATEFSDFAKMPETRRELVNLEKVVLHSAELFSEGNSASIRIHSLPEKECMVEADSHQLLRAFNNLIKNARQALDDQPGGRIDIRFIDSGSFWEVRVEDNGPGIAANEADKIFNPNFTTKSSGMGLGLAIVRSIVEESGGSVNFSSDPGIATIFSIKLPKAKA
jgi:two-component system, NtrC family, nitrogen regulation sensor histidine kinase NtrY